VATLAAVERIVSPADLRFALDVMRRRVPVGSA
jgi:hypothetical protein